MKKQILAILIALGAGFGLAPMARADDAAQTVKQQRASMTPEEKAAARQQAKANWAAKTPDEQAAAKAQFAQKHPKAAARMTAKKDESATK